MKRTATFLTTTALLLAASVAAPCSVAVVSGDATPDGRPLLWKNRDTDTAANRVMAFEGPRFAFLGIANTGDADGADVWAGANEAGFCIMNSASYNLPTDFDPSTEGEEGAFMRRALGECATVADFQQLLESTTGHRKVSANFGVIDAQGGAAFFETSDAAFARFDASDRRVAPEGYLVRTNFSFTGTPAGGAGYIRFDRVAALFHEEATGGGIRRDWLLTTASRDMVNGMTGVDPLAGTLPADARDRRMFYMNDSVTRDSAASTVVFQGPAKGEGPERTIMWTRLGHPLCSVALPLFVAGADGLRLTVGGADGAPIDRFALGWLARLFPYPKGGRGRYMDLAPVANRAGNGLLQVLPDIEEAVLRHTDALLRALPPGTAGLVRVEREAEDLVISRLRERYPEACAAAGL